jgi:hypothetical protein
MVVTSFFPLALSHRTFFMVSIHSCNDSCEIQWMTLHRYHHHPPDRCFDGSPPAPGALEVCTPESRTVDFTDSFR